MKIFDKLTDVEWWVNRLGWIWHNFIKWILLGIAAIIAFILLNIIGVLIVGAFNRRKYVFNTIKWFGWTFFKLPLIQYRKGRHDWKTDEWEAKRRERLGIVKME